MIKEILIRDEGCKLKPYTDSVGKLTIGVGRNLDDNGITYEEAMLMLDHDLTIAEHEAENFTWFYDLNDARQAVIISMIFNMGLPTLKKFKKTIACLEKQDYWQASIEMLDSVWAEQVGPRAQRLSRMMETGKYDQI